MPSELLESTTSGVLRKKGRTWVLLGRSLALPAHSHTSSEPEAPSAWHRVDITSAGPRIARSDTVIARIRRLSGLTWEQLAQVCGTSRRTLHLWASGRRMNATNEERLLRILAILQHIDTGSADRNRRRLLEVRHDGASIVDLIERGLFGRAAEAAGLPQQLSSVAPEVAPRPLQAERRPPAPVDLLDTMHDAVHEEPAPRANSRFRRLRRNK